MRDDLSGLMAFLAVARRRSFTAAASELGVTPSAVSQSLRALEVRVGVRLLQRTTRSVGLTEAGSRFLSRLEPAMHGVQDAFESLGELRDRPTGLLRLTLPRYGYQEVLGPRLAEFLTAHPDIRVDIHLDDVLVDIVQQGFDAGFRVGELVNREMIAIPVSGDIVMHVVGSPAYFANRGKPKHPRELRDHDCINYRSRTTGGLLRWGLSDGGKRIEVAVEGRAVFDDAELVLDAAVAGLGLAYVPESRIRKLLAEKRLVRVLEPYSTTLPGFFLYYPSRAQVAPKLKALIDFFKLKRRR
ncbi:LysR family transcriptional regulator [Corallococcus exiguus]|uniref:LysR family transcriptional regulator n=1 Tax=Corallococcus exiguus TaxID=83462 RepID=A0A7X5BMU4_9BACT|nr:LysR family transcriptional regulator [Corallococcus exiguus]NBC38356.1 LysR family transcriptional regulator [Corallococcus exiguus]TNV51098.1 LysR family transcriptional regulator [Corallococcus exiguus]